MKISKYISKQSKKASCCMGKSSIIDDVLEDDEPPLVDSGRTQKTGRISRTNKTDNDVLGETADGIPFQDDGIVVEDKETTRIIINTKPPSCSPSRRRNSRPKRVPSIDQDDSQFRISTGSSRRPSSDCSTRRPSLCSSMGSMRSLQAYSQHTTSAPAPSGQCPYRHGTVYTDPYPGYIHGNPKVIDWGLYSFCA